jgi:hypothetical protein
MQQLKSTAIKQGKSCTITFTATQYVAPLLNNKTVNLSDYGGGVIYGKAPGYSSTFPLYPASVTVNARGLPGAEFRVYLTNDKGSNYYMVKIGPSGVLRLLRCAPGSTVYQ